MRERLPRQSQSAKDDSIIRFNPPQTRTITIQGLVIVAATVVSGLRVVAVGISVWWLIPLSLALYILMLCIDVSVEVTSTEIAVWPWLGQLVHLPWQHRYPIWALVDIQRLRYGSLRLIFIAGGRERRIILWSLGFPPRNIPALLRTIQINRTPH
ncbi:MAG TPA: hypothetical protein VH599_14975 [Ktedonobacterales bacterium]|jgi:hypothetical protein